MSRQQHTLEQGSPEWHAYRAKHLNASDAPAMLGVSPYKKRDELIAQYATGDTKEVSAHVQSLFDAGHDYEAAARAIAEKIIGDDLYPVVMSFEVDGLPLSASLDGLTMDEETGWEHKSLNKNLRESLAAGKIPEQYHPQLEQQLLVTGATRILFMASNGTEDTAIHAWYESNPALRKQLIAGWARFMEDVAAYKPPVAAPEVIAAPIKQLPALSVQVSGKVEASNLVVYQESALALIDSIKTDLKTDEDFVNAKAMVKFCGEAETQLDAAKRMVLGQMASVDEVLRTIDLVQEQVRQKRLTLDKLVTSKEAQIKQEIRDRGAREVAEHIAALNARIGKSYMPVIKPDFVAVTKGLRTLASMNSAVNDHVAMVRINADATANRIEKNLLTLKEKAEGYQTLFAGDEAFLVLKEEDELVAIIESRIAKHNAEQAAALERVRVAAEVKARAEQAAAATQEMVSAGTIGQPQIGRPPLTTGVDPARGPSESAIVIVSGTPQGARLSVVPEDDVIKTIVGMLNEMTKPEQIEVLNAAIAVKTRRKQAS